MKNENRCEILDNCLFSVLILTKMHVVSQNSLAKKIIYRLESFNDFIAKL